MKKLLSILVVMGSFGFVAHADEAVFGYVYGAETLPQGGLEFYQWVTYREGKGMGTYQAVDLKTELEYGITDRFQVSGYLNFAYHNVKDLMPHFEDQPAGLEWQGAQAAFKYNVLSPFKDIFGFALYLEPGYAQIDKVTGAKVDEIEMELKLILQKNFLENQLVWALNLSPEIEWEKSGSESMREFIFEYSTGLSYRFIPNWFGAVEMRYHSEYPDFGKREHYAYFAGPTIHYGGERWWWTLTYMPQIKGGPSDHMGSGNKHYMEHENSETRLKVGYNF